jgi:hypothetical protein
MNFPAYFGAFSRRPAKRLGTGLMSCNLFRLFSKKPGWRSPLLKVSSTEESNGQA